MNSICDKFDKFRDGELESERLKQFESHLASCPECRMKAHLLNNVVEILHKEVPSPLPLSAQEISARVLEKRSRSWDVQLLSWLRPAPAWAAAAALLILLLLFPTRFGFQPEDPVTDYEVLMAEVTPGAQTETPSSAWSDNQLEQWLQQGGGVE